MAETSNKITITEFKKLDDSNRWLALWDGIGTLWNKVEILIGRVDIIEDMAERHEKLLVSGNAEENEPSVMERVRKLEELALKIEKISNAMILQTLAFLFTMIGIGVTFFLKVYPALVALANKP